VFNVDLDIDGVADDKEETIGGLVVKRADGNNAPRKKITLDSTLTIGNVTLDKNNTTKVKVFTAATGGTEITFNETDNKFPVGDLPKDLYVEGATESATMRDVTLTLTHNLGSSDTVKFTVLWVDLPTVKVGASDTVSDDNDKRDAYKGWTVANTYNLGPQEYDEDFVARMGWGTEAGAGAHPPGFDFPANNIKLERDAEFHDWIGNGNSTILQESFSASIPPGDDTGPAGARDNNPDPNGFIYDWDAPGLSVATAPENQIKRTRNNFKAFASITVDGTAVRCSPVREYFVRFSMKQLDAPNGTNWVVIAPPDVANDKQAGNGTTKLSWDLNSPTITSITPNNGTNDGPINITNLAGTSFAGAATVKLTKAGQGDIVATNVAVVSGSKITCTFDLTGKATGPWNVVVINEADPTAATLNNGFTINAP